MSYSAVTAAFGQRLFDEVDLATVAEHLPDAVGATLQRGHLDVLVTGGTHPTVTVPEHPSGCLAGQPSKGTAMTDSRDTTNWAAPVEYLTVAPGGAGNRDAVQARRLSGPVQGFGKLWQKTYRVRLEALELSPEEVVTAWKANYGAFWPAGNRFTAPLAGLAPGEVSLISSRTAGLTLSTGVLVLYSDEVSFAFLTPEGHSFAGMITFSAASDPDGATVAQVQPLIRSHDPIIECVMALGGARKEDLIWMHTLRSLASHLGVDREPTKTIVCVDSKRHWRRAGNVRHDPGLHAAIRPFRRRTS